MPAQPKDDPQVEAFMEAYAAADPATQATVRKLFDANRDDEAAAVLGFIIASPEGWAGTA
jgi:hypothetical protein